MSIEVLSPGMLTTLQDGGRHGHAALGIGAAGAMDAVALRLANILVGNVENAAALEITLRGPRLRLREDALIALAGADIDASCDGAALPSWRPLALRAGAELVFGGMRHGARCYLAIAGGFDGPAPLGSRSVDVNAGIGRALAAGQTLTRAAAPSANAARLLRAQGAAKKWALDPAPWFDAAGTTPIGIVRGAHFERLDADSRQRLFDSPFRVGVDSNRVGYRLEGAALTLRESFELISEAVTPGTLQLPPGGQPIALMAEAPTTGGYARIAHVAAVDLPRLAQRRPGDTVHFVELSLADAQTRYLERECALAALARHVAERLDD